MPKLLNQSDDMETGTIPGLASYNFSGISVERLGASEYTLVTLAVDVSGSVTDFLDQLKETVKTAIAGCRKSPKAGNILVRVITFSNDITEIHGFKPLDEIDDAVYDRIAIQGMTALFDAASSGVGAMTEYGRKLVEQDYGVNGILYVITDGADNISKYGAEAVKDKIHEAVTGEVLESCVSVLIGVNASQSDVKQYLEKFRRDAGITEYVDAGNATPGNMAKLAGFISRSVSSQASAQGSGQAAPVSGGIVI